MRKRFALAVSVVSAASTTLLAAPAEAGQDVTFAITAGSLTVSDPADTNLGSAAVGTSTLSASLGATTVSDGRGALLGSWSVSVSATDFETGAGTADETIPKSAVDYWSGPATASSGTAVLVPGQAAALVKQDLGSARTAFSATGVVGQNSATWAPTVVVNVPSDAVAGTYTGTITHSVTGG